MASGMGSVKCKELSFLKGEAAAVPSKCPPDLLLSADAQQSARTAH